MHGTETAVTVVVTITGPEDPTTERVLRSLRRQTNEDWELLILHTEPWPVALDPDRDALLRGGRHQHVQIGGESELVDPAEMVETAYLAVVPPGAFLEPQAVAQLTEELGRSADADLAYTDLDVVDSDGVPATTEFLPDWSPQLLRSVPYLRGLVAIRTETARAVGGANADPAGAWVDDLALRIAEHDPEVLHLTAVLVHRPNDGDQAPPPLDRSQRVRDHYARRGLNATVVAGESGNLMATLVPNPTTVSIVIPTRGGHGDVLGRERCFVTEAVRSIVRRSYTVEYEIIVVHDEQADRAYLADLTEFAGSALRVVDFHGPFNFSAKVNLGVANALGDVMVLLNDDIEVRSEDWLDRLVAYAQEEDVGAVGAKLLFEDGSIQHAGLMYHAGEFQHVGFHLPNTPGLLGLNARDREVVGVTAACMAIRRDVWERLGGMDETLPNNFNDVDLCWRLRQHGYRIVQANSVVLNHFESMTREPSVSGWEAARIMARLGGEVGQRDPYTFPEPGEAVSPGERNLREWARVSAEVWRREGPGSFWRKARGRLGR